MIKSTYIFFVFFMLTAVWSCNRPSDMQREHPAVSSIFYADSLRTLGRGIRLIKEEKERLAFPPLDSVFRLPVDDVLTTEELRRLSSESLRRLMIYFNLMMNFESGYQYFDSLERAKHPVVSRYCRRELWVVKAQMLMALDRHAEAVDYLNRAMALKDENNDPLSEIFCTATAGITYMGVDTISTRAESAFRRACRVAERSGLSNYWLYPQAIGRLADIYLQQGGEAQVPEGGGHNYLFRLGELVGIAEAGMVQPALGQQGLPCLKEGPGQTGEILLFQPQPSDPAMFRQRGYERFHQLPGPALAAYAAVYHKYIFHFEFSFLSNSAKASRAVSISRVSPRWASWAPWA